MTTTDNPGVELAIETLSGDLRDAVLHLLREKHDPIPFAKRKEVDQRALIAAVAERTRELVEEAVSLIAAKGGGTIAGTLDQVTIKGGLKAVVTLSKTDPLRHKLFDAQGGDVLIALADARPFMGERQSANAHVSPDQSDIIQYAEEVNEANEAAGGDFVIVQPDDEPGALSEEAVEGMAEGDEAEGGAEPADEGDEEAAAPLGFDPEATGDGEGEGDAESGGDSEAAGEGDGDGASEAAGESEETPQPKATARRSRNGRGGGRKPAAGRSSGRRGATLQ